MDLKEALPPNERMLAQLTVTKLGKVMHGLLSVGTAALEMDSPADFLAGREKTPLGFLEVLHCIGVNHEHVDELPELRERVAELTDLTSQFFRVFTELANWRQMSSPDLKATVDRLCDRYTRFCQRLGLFCSMLGMDNDYTQQATQDTYYIGTFFQTVRPEYNCFESHTPPEYNVS